MARFSAVLPAAVVAPVRERGLKLLRCIYHISMSGRSREGARIEICRRGGASQRDCGRSREGARIEIYLIHCVKYKIASLP